MTAFGTVVMFPTFNDYFFSHPVDFGVLIPLFLIALHQLFPQCLPFHLLYLLHGGVTAECALFPLINHLPRFSYHSFLAGEAHVVYTQGICALRFTGRYTSIRYCSVLIVAARARNGSRTTLRHRCRSRLTVSWTRRGVVLPGHSCPTDRRGCTPASNPLPWPEIPP